MTQDDTYTPPPAKTMDDINALVAFIKARVQPLRDAVLSDTEEYKAFQALLDITVYTKGSAESEIEHGDSPSLQFHHLAMTASRWDDHPDFLPAWTG
ncbi:hypothetical protein F3K34_43680 [Streptomyces sp. LBUM 1486]|uniref:hypothetical protein n=1 Tax=Streptomyces scabiei TaxID=1930 RepID=UPI001B32F545|nr:hypothetical protein [Streptomyces sp. LBUM 1486]MBP5918688.1 hypothetical protein [Streptomyces sp. LBUM 1486]